MPDTAAPPKIEDARARREAEEEAGHGADLPGEDAPTGEAGEGAGKGEDDEAQEPAFPKPELLGEGQLTLSVGGEKPNESKIKMSGVSIEVPNKGQFNKGQFIDVVVRCRVAGVHVDDLFDNQTGVVTGTIRRHILKPLRVERVD